MASLQQVVREKIFSEVIYPHNKSRGDAATQPNNTNGAAPDQYKESQWKVLVLDPLSTRMVSACCKMHEIMAEGITLVEDLTKMREPLPSLDAIYLITPTNQSIDMFLSDFAEHGRWTYRAAHVYFTEAIPHDLFGKMCKHPVTKYKAIKTLKEINCAYLPYESRVFSLDTRDLFNAFYSPERALDRSAALERAAEQIATLCVTLGEFPAVRFRSGCDKNTEFAQLVQQKLVAYKADDPSMGEGPNKDKSQLIIVDRGFDLFSPLVHELTLQAMAYDILEIENDVYTFSKNTGAGVKEAEVILDESDDLWREFRHKHIAEALTGIPQRLSAFTHDKKLTTSNKNTLADISQMVKKVPQYQKELNNFTTHMSLTEDCFSVYQERLKTICTVEQEIASGIDTEGERIKDPMRVIVPIMLDSKISVSEKLRVMLLYIIYKGGITEENFNKLFSHAGISDPDVEKLKLINLQYLGTPVTTVEGSRKKLYTAYMATNRRERTEDVQFAQSRWVPYLKDLIEDACADRLDQRSFPYLNSAARGGRGNAPVSARSRYNWVTGRSQPRSGPRVIFFVVGGLTYSEIRSAYEVAQSPNCKDRDILVGSSHIITAEDFLTDIGNLTGNKSKEEPPPPMM